MAGGSPRHDVPRNRARGVLVLCVLAWLTRLSWDAVFAVPSSAASRRDAIGGVTSAIAAAIGIVAPSAEAYELPPLGYAYDALEPSIDKETMTIHHDKHHN
eukprot:CAMPEP_0179124084 /NCGR_PEP_ID=MMETSP0796-20121207/58622_1 /TAXON_ID=73915 /ORGANISM="Pyrodinium bahamense, Strain pbaha01" /LENGTH=100 /DNA_ID=CAMNT_0020822733 /DNA_START=41 /DNA_END=340 /DNA_ORIENTATION=+